MAGRKNLDLKALMNTGGQFLQFVPLFFGAHSLLAIIDTEGVSLCSYFASILAIVIYVLECGIEAVRRIMI
ncbi:hypothetical protein J5J09_14300 [Ciceribacter sp. L1K22]|nr:hypothetical protein [Ciceribacter sp. L1K22]